MSLSPSYIRNEKAAITDKDCLQNVLILAVWDDVIPVFDQSPEAIFQIYPRCKTVWWKIHLLCSDYRLLQPNEQTFVLSTSPVWTTSSWLCSYLYFTTCHFSCQKVALVYFPWNVGKATHRASRQPWGLREHLTMTFINIYKSDRETILLATNPPPLLHLQYIYIQPLHPVLAQHTKDAHFYETNK